MPAMPQSTQHSSERRRRVDPDRSWRGVSSAHLAANSAARNSLIFAASSCAMLGFPYGPKTTSGSPSPPSVTCQGAPGSLASAFTKFSGECFIRAVYRVAMCINRTAIAKATDRAMVTITKAFEFMPDRTANGAPEPGLTHSAAGQATQLPIPQQPRLWRRRS